jgi:transcriptional regulator with XRE-family HTH domain
MPIPGRLQSGAVWVILVKFIYMTQPLLGTRIAELRNQKGITQKELADACNIDIRTIQRIETGKVLPRMYTIRLLAAALGTDISYFSSDTAQVEMAQTTSLLKGTFIAGIIFSLNYIPIVLNIITLGADSVLKNVFTVLHIISCVFFFRGFYLLGKQTQNQAMTISALLAMVLLPLLNMMNIMQGLLFFDTINMMVILIVACVNAIVFGMSFIRQGGSLYKVAGYITLVQSALFLTGNFQLVSVGLIISVFCNFVMTAILYKESGAGHTPEEDTEIKKSYPVAG